MHQDHQVLTPGPAQDTPPPWGLLSVSSLLNRPNYLSHSSHSFPSRPFTIFVTLWTLSKYLNVFAVNAHNIQGEDDVISALPFAINMFENLILFSPTILANFNFRWSLATQFFSLQWWAASLPYCFGQFIKSLTLVKSSILKSVACKMFCCNAATESKIFHQNGNLRSLLPSDL